MNAMRKGHTKDQSDAGETRLVDAIRRFAAPAREAFGVWQSFDSEFDVLRAVIAEIEETVLPRGIRVTGKETGAFVLLTIANRRLIQIEGFEVAETGDFAEACVAGLRRGLAGCWTLKFDLVDRNPKLPRTDRSCSARALTEAAHHVVLQAEGGSSFDELVEEIRSKSEAWLGSDGTSSDDGHDAGSESVQLLSQYMSERAKQRQDRSQVHIGRPTLSILPAGKRHILVVLESQALQTLALFRKRRRDHVVAAWRAYVGAFSD